MIRFHTLGPLDLRGSDGQELGDILAQPKRVALLAYLALAAPRGPQRRDILLALFWPEHDAEHARNSLSQSIHVLRRSLGADMLVSRNGHALGLERANLWCDALAFEEALDGGNAAAAVELYRGDLLEGLHISDASEFDRWLEAERARLAGRYARALEAVAEQRQAAGDVQEAVTWWRRLAAREPYSSRAALRLMEALAAAGDPGGAVQHARVHEVLLREELDIAPDPDVAAFIKQLQSVPAESHEPRLSGVDFGSSGLTSEPQPEPGAGPASQDGSVSPGRPRRRAAVLAAPLLVLFAITGAAIVLRNGAREPPLPLIRSIAVLPFDNLSRDSVQQPLIEGLHDLLITELARYPELSVISRTSVLQYNGTKKRLPEIARELKVDGVVEGTVLREGGRVRMNAQLLHGPSDRHVWAEHYERDLRDVLVLQAELAQAIAREVNIATRPPQRPRPRADGPADSTPQELFLRELYLQGRHAELNRSHAGVHNARAAYLRAIELDSTFALGYAGLSDVYEYMAVYSYAPPGPALDTARMMARRAVALDSTSPEARTAFAVALGDGGDFAGAEREFRRAIELGPSNARAHYMYSILLVALGRGEDALRETQRSAELDPFAPRGVLAMRRYAEYLITGQRSYLKKLPVRERRPILKLEPGEPWARAREGVEYAQEGRCAEARSEIRLAQQLVPPDNLIMLRFVGLMHWSCGEHARARAILTKMKRHSSAHEHGFHIASLHVAFGETDSAFVWLDRQRWNLAELSSLSAGRWVDPLRSDPRFSQVLRRLRLRL